MVVRMRHTKSHTKNRRSHHALVGGGFSKCPNCGMMKVGHAVCKNCGYYGGRKVLDLVKQTERAQKREKARKMRE